MKSRISSSDAAAAFAEVGLLPDLLLPLDMAYSNLVNTLMSPLSLFMRVSASESLQGEVQV